MEAVSIATTDSDDAMQQTLPAEIFERPEALTQEQLAPLDLESIDNKQFAATLDRQPFGSGSITRLELSAGVLTLQNYGQNFSGLLALLQITGSSTLRQPIVDSSVATGDLVVVDCSQPFRLSTERNSCYLVIMLPAECTSRAFGLVGTGSRHVARSVGSCAIATSLMNTIFENADALCNEDPNSMLDLLSGALERAVLTCEAAPLSTSKPRAYHLSRIKSYVRKHMRDPVLNPEAIAKAVGVSRRYLDDLFQNEGTSIAKYIWAGRLQGCKRDLADHRLAGHSVTEIAFSWGFNSASHFSRTFSERYGVCPSRARARIVKSNMKSSCNRLPSETATGDRISESATVSC